MAFELETPPAAATIGAVQVVTSAVLELTFIGLGLVGSYRRGVVAGLDEDHPELARRLREFWGDGVPWLGDLMVVADRTGTLAADDLEPFFVALDHGVPDGTLHLESETADERRAIAARLAALTADEALRRRYVLLLREVWDTCKAVLLDSRVAVAQTVEVWSGRLAAGEHLLDLLHDKHIARWPQFADLVRSAERAGTVLLTPGATCTGGSIVALEHSLSIAAPLVRQSPVELRRAAATEIAGRLKVLNDPTRVALLSHLACHPASVTELAATFSLAQPTVSIHVRQLREAGLAESRRKGGRTIYSVPRDRVQRLLAETGDLLLRFCDPE